MSVFIAREEQLAGMSQPPGMLACVPVRDNFPHAERMFHGRGNPPVNNACQWLFKNQPTLPTKVSVTRGTDTCSVSFVRLCLSMVAYTSDVSPPCNIETQTGVEL